MPAPGNRDSAEAHAESGVDIAALIRDLLVELARWSRVAELNGDLHARIASALALDEERREQEAELEKLRRRANYEGIDIRGR